MSGVGLVTIGQSPRTDVTPAIRAHLPDDVEVVEKGALDPYSSAEEVENAIGAEDGAPMFVTSLRDGTDVAVDRIAIHELLHQRVTELEEQVDVIGVLCTGEFPTHEVTIPVLEPRSLLKAWVDAIVDPDEIIGVVIPSEDQVAQTSEKWNEYSIQTVAVNPYDDTASFARAGTTLGTEPAAVVMDCIGYTEAMKATIRESTDTSVLLGRSVLAKTLAEIL